MTRDALEAALVECLRAALMPLFAGINERQAELSALLDRLEEDLRRERAAQERPADGGANESGAAVFPCGVSRRAAVPDATIAEDGRSVLLMDPADDPRWWVSFRLPIWAGIKGDEAIARVTPDLRHVVVAGDPEARPELFVIPEAIRCDLRRHGAITEE